MKHKASIMRYLIVAMLAVMCAVCCFVGCKDDGQGNTDAEHTVTWDVAEHATAKAEGYDTLPTKVKDGTAIVFTIECDSGYEVDTVKRGDRNVTAASGKYTVTVTADVTISVTVKQAIQSVNVTTKPTKNTYYAGETVDKAGMVVEVEYVGGTKQTLGEADYRISYQGGSAATGFKVGDTYFKVSYQGKESAEVALDSTVVALVTLDLDGATLSDAYLNGLKANTELSNVKVENGVLSFTFAAKLTKAVALPTGADLKKGENDGDYDFTGWTDGITSLAIGEETSYNLTASFAPNLVRLNKVYYETQDNVPYLILEGTFQLANNFYLYLYEGNDKVEVSDKAGELTGDRGKAFTYKFDMRNLAEARTEDDKDYSGKWMDIKIVYGEGDEMQVMDIDLNRYPADFVDTSATLTWGDYVFSFATYTPSGTNAVHLKAVYNPKPSEYSFTVKGGKTAEGLPTLILEGTAASQFEGQFARVDIETVAEAQYGKIEGGKWTVTFVLGPGHFNLNEKGYMHFNIVENETAGKGDGWKPNNDNNLGNVACANTDLVDNGDFALDGSNGYLLNGATLRIANDDDSLVYYVGPGKWGGFIIFGVNEKYIVEQTADDVALKVDSMETPTKVYYVATFKLQGKGFEAEGWDKLIKFGNTDGTITVYDCEKVEEFENGIYRMWFDITSYSGSQLWPNIYLEVAGADGAQPTYQKLLELKDADHSVDGLYAIVGGTKYTMHCASGEPYYDGPCIVPEAASAGEKNPESADPTKLADITEPEPKPELPEGAIFTPTAVTIESQGDAAYYVIKGTYSGCTGDELKAYLAVYYFDFQVNGGNYARTSNLPRTIETTADAFTVKINVTSLGTNKYATHIGDENTNFTLEDTTNHGTNVTVGEKVYELVNVPGSGEASDCWGTVGLWVKPNVAAPGMKFDTVTIELDESDTSKLYYTITITFTDADANDAKITEWLKEITLVDGGYSASVAKSEKVADKQYKVFFNVADYTGTQLWPHVYYHGAGWDAGSGDVKCSGSGSVTFNGKTYYYEDGWNMPTMKVQ